MKPDRVFDMVTVQHDREAIADLMDVGPTRSAKGIRRILDFPRPPAAEEIIVYRVDLQRWGAVVVLLVGEDQAASIIPKPALSDRKSVV